MTDLPSLPRGEADLDAWHVYGDTLLERGDPRGELIALELSLPATPDAEALARFRTAARSLLGDVAREAKIGWCLGHARTLRIRSAGFQPIASATLLELVEFLSTPIGARLESLSLSLAVNDFSTSAWRRFARALPPTCTRLALKLRNRVDPAERHILDELPDGVRVLEVESVPPSTSSTTASTSCGFTSSPRSSR